MKRVIKNELEVDQFGRTYAKHKSDMTDDEREQITETHINVFSNCPNCGAALAGGARDQRGNCSVCGIATCVLCEAKCICGNPLCKSHRSSVGELAKAQKCCPKCAAEQKQGIESNEALENRKYILDKKIELLKEELSIFQSGHSGSSEEGDDLMVIMQANRLKKKLAELGADIAKEITHEP
ncbi:MAG: hypothetical protein A2021_03765 [Elusimicrobia bacterium GWF2_52_66]|nr:MAG: hypothetical protein A2X33_10050 [Elusimicrobia bacterium GWA2_51_34]OGR84705.1 MAG: hypothetical protein A2021_03765 [Elusimicrobia bacterium GWF2_52_66]